MLHQNTSLIYTLCCCSSHPSAVNRRQLCTATCGPTAAPDHNLRRSLQPRAHALSMQTPSTYCRDRASCARWQAGDEYSTRRRGNRRRLAGKVTPCESHGTKKPSSHTVRGYLHRKTSAQKVQRPLQQQFKFRQLAQSIISPFAVAVMARTAASIVLLLAAAAVLSADASAEAILGGEC